MGDPTSDGPIRRAPPPRWLLRLINPLVRPLVLRSKTLQRYVLIFHVVGLKSGKTYHIPAGYHLAEGKPVVVSNARWRKNLPGGRDIAVTFRGRRRPAGVELVDEPNTVASFLEARFAEYGRTEFRARLGFQVDRERSPSKQEWTKAVEQSRMSLIRIEFRDEPSPSDP